MSFFYYIFFFQADDGIRDADVTGVQTCALPICLRRMRRELRRRGVDARTEAEKRSDAQRRAHAAQAPATERQIDYLTSLLVRRANTGEGGGFVGGVDALVDAGGKVDVDALRRLTRPQASRLIDSLRGSY